MVQVLLSESSSMATKRGAVSGRCCFHRVGGCVVIIGGRKLFILLLVGIAIWNNQRSSSSSSPTSVSKGSDQQRATSTTTIPSPVISSSTNNTTNNNNQGKNQNKLQRLSRKQLLDVLSPPGVNHSQFVVSSSSTPKKGFMVKCNVDKWSTYIMRELYYLYDGLIQIYGFEEINLDQLRQLAGSTSSSITTNSQQQEQQQEDELPDVLFLCEPSILYLDYIFPWLTQLKLQKPTMQIIYHTDDLQSAMNKVDTDLLGKAFQTFDTYIGTYAYEIQHYLRNVPIDPSKMPTIVWIPHSVSPEFFISTTTGHNNNNNNNDEEEEEEEGSSSLSSSLIRPTTTQQEANNNNNITTKSNNALIRDRIVLPGKINSKYPIRMWALKEKSKSKQRQQQTSFMLDIMKHNGYNIEHDNTQQIDFATTISKYATAFTCGSIFHYIVAKMFEIPAVGTLMLVNNDVSDLLQALGFIDGIHYKSYNSMDPIPTLKWAIDPLNINEIDMIRQKGYELVKNYHQVGHRLQAIMMYLVEGKQTYAIPETYKSNPCPILTYDNEQSCLKEYHQRTTKPMLPV